MAYAMRDAIDKLDGITAKVRTVLPVVIQGEKTQPVDADADDVLYATKEELTNCSGLILGSPTRFGNMAAPLKFFIDSTSDVWLSGGLVGKPAGVFTSSSTQHGGQETTLMSMMLPLLHHGAYLVGVPYSESALNETETGGTPYGPSHVAGVNNLKGISPHELKICQHLATRIGQLALKLRA